MLDFDVVCDDRHDYSNGPHAHADDMLFLPLDGLFSISARDDGRPELLDSSNVWWVPSRHVHQVKATPGQRHLCYYLDMPSLLAAHRATDAPPRSGAQRWMMSTYLSDLLRLRAHLRHRRSMAALLTQAELDRTILAEVGRIVTATAPTRARERDQLIQAIKTFVHAHLDEDLSCHALAERAQISARTLARWFQFEEGKSVGQYVLQARLAEARRLLRSTALPISDIQHAVGFTSAAHFAYSIRRIYGVAPRQLRGHAAPDRQD
ncbi:helix-turn-helix transcriptional regulator [Bordetella genomosp. 13]|uniref:AraC family transcriptional regulator n=1 Tax=Bordetella genomosp. 13 TaxID=463040 RepID=UPI0011A28C0B|nr:helix-turn-helix transcriptional regulator [Bordetella genomosp. 13]